MMLDFKQSCIILDKPSGISSNHALSKVKKKLSQRKAGFSGTLDPLASGLLIIFLNKATKLCSSFLNADKSYKATIKLGITSTTGDITGEIISSSKIPDIRSIDLKKIEEKFMGSIEQTPPMYSALKYKGIRLYEYARKGIYVHRDSRNVVIHNINLRHLNEGNLLLEVNCSKGTYIRTLAEKIGEEIGCGALISSLKRTKIADIDLSKSINLDILLSSTTEEIFDKYIINVDLLLSDTTTHELLDNEVVKILNGSKIKTNKRPSKTVKIYDYHGRFIGVGEINENSELLPKKILL
ncbi:MAG: tRNA pseudouridine(55) synthase TruB [Gammaproteobacteria bacterium]|nr:tRNA pseudouridine(55) synthase TruB [Gammaproteobacteria bacterium]